MTDKTQSRKIDRYGSGKNFSEILKNLFTILALVVGGYWTYTKFVRVEAPSLEPRGTASSGVSWNDLGSGKCEAVLDEDFANSGNTSFEINKMEIRVWKFRRDSNPGQFVTYLDIDEVRKKGQVIFEKSYSEKPSGGINMFIGHYSPTNTFRHSFVFSMNRAPGESVYFEATYYMNGSDHVTAYTGTWDTICNVSRPAPGPSPTPR
jgi:hypothetical protein